MPLPIGVRKRIKQALVHDLDRWMTLAEIMRHMYGPPGGGPGGPSREAYSDKASSVSSQANRMVERGLLLRKDNVGPRGGYGYQLSDNEKKKLKNPVSKFTLIQEDPFI